MREAAGAGKGLPGVIPEGGSVDLAPDADCLAARTVPVSGLIPRQALLNGAPASGGTSTVMPSCHQMAERKASQGKTCRGFASGFSAN